MHNILVNEFLKLCYAKPLQKWNHVKCPCIYGHINKVLPDFQAYLFKYARKHIHKAVNIMPSFIIIMRNISA